MEKVFVAACDPLWKLCSRLDLLMKGKWDEFSLGDFVKREDAIVATTIDENVLNERKNIRIDKMIAAGEYGRAFNLIGRGQKLLLPSQDVFNKLQSKQTSAEK